MEVTISKGKLYTTDANSIEEYVVYCINEAIERLKDHNLVKENPVQYVLKKIVGYDDAYDSEWQPYARFAKHNLADTQESLKFIQEHYDAFKETVNDMADDMGKSEFYPCMFEKGFDLVRLTVCIYTEIAHRIGNQLELLD